MKANELRIGNLVLLTKDNFITTKEYRLDGIDIYKLDESECIDIKSMPLTEEFYRKIQKQLFEAGLEYSYSSITNRLFIYIGNRTIICDFIHNIQNLYFALTNEELEYEL